jgi:hypothetical protein
MSISPQNGKLSIKIDKFGKHNEDKLQSEEVSLPEFLISSTSVYVVKLVSDEAQQTQPSKTRAELLADGQCEV